MYSSAWIKHPSGHKRTFWSTESRYPYGNHARTDFVEVDMSHGGDGAVGLAQTVSFLRLHNLPPSEHPKLYKDLVLIRWLSPSSLSTSRDKSNRPLCDYPLSSNHALWEWSRTPRLRRPYNKRGFRRLVNRQGIWNHVPQFAGLRNDCITAESHAYFDVIEYDSIIRHANVARDPTTGHMLQTIQIL